MSKTSAEQNERIAKQYQWSSCYQTGFKELRDLTGSVNPVARQSIDLVSLSLDRFQVDGVRVDLAKHIYR